MKRQLVPTILLAVLGLCHPPVEAERPGKNLLLSFSTNNAPDLPFVDELGDSHRDGPLTMEGMGIAVNSAPGFSPQLQDEIDEEVDIHAEEDEEYLLSSSRHETDNGPWRPKGISITRYYDHSQDGKSDIAITKTDSDGDGVVDIREVRGKTHIYVFQYDKKGRKVEQTRWFKKDGKWALTRIFKYYDPHGELWKTIEYTVIDGTTTGTITEKVGERIVRTPIQ